MTLAAGTMDRRITLQRRTDTPGTTGEPVPTWAAFATVWASFMPQRMSEAFEAARDTASRFAVFTIRWRTDLSEKDRIVFDDGSGSKNWDIRQMDQVGRREGWRIVAEAVD